MYRILTNLLIPIVCGLLWIIPAEAAKSPPRVGDIFPDISLAVPSAVADRNYLGLSGSGTFKIPQIAARVVIVEIFSMYCPYCQKEAPVVNKLYQTIETNPAWQGKIKIVGIGAGNSIYEVELFKKRYQIPFPLISDAEFAAYDRIGGEVRTPYFMAVQINRDGTSRVLFSQLGALGDVEKFLQAIVKAAGL